MDLESLPDDELDQVRRGSLAEQERRQKLHDGKELIGQVVRDYLEAAKLDCPDVEDAELGQAVVDLLTGHPPELSVGTSAL